MCRNILAIFIGFLITILLSLELLFGLAFIRLTNSDFHKESLSQVDFYNSIQSSLENLTLNALAQAGGAKLSLDFTEDTKAFIEASPAFKNYYALIQQESSKVFTGLISSEDIKVTVESNIDRFLSFLNSNTPDLNLYFPEDSFLDNLGQILTDVYKISQDYIKTVKTCSISETDLFYRQLEANNKTTLTCLPPEIIADFKNNFSTAANSEEEILREIRSSSPFFNGDNEVSLRELDNLNEESGSNLLENAQNFRQSFNLVKILLAVNLFVITILILLFIVIAKFKFFRRVWVLGLFLLSATLTSLGVAITAKALITYESSTQYSLNNIFRGQYEVFGNLIKQFVTGLFDYISTTSFALSFILLIIVVVAFALDFAAKKLKPGNEFKEKPSEPATPDA